jgi:hypothetical protein
MSTHF